MKVTKVNINWSCKYSLDEDDSGEDDDDDEEDESTDTSEAGKEKDNKQGRKENGEKIGCKCYIHFSCMRALDNVFFQLVEYL